MIFVMLSCEFYYYYYYLPGSSINHQVQTTSQTEQMLQYTVSELVQMSVSWLFWWHSNWSWTWCRSHWPNRHHWCTHRWATHWPHRSHTWQHSQTWGYQAYIYPIYRVWQNKVAPGIFCSFLSKFLELQREILHTYLVIICAFNSCISI